MKNFRKRIVMLLMAALICFGIAKTAGHKFTLSFSGYVYDANGRGEYVYNSDSK